MKVITDRSEEETAQRIEKLKVFANEMLPDVEGAHTFILLVGNDEGYAALSTGKTVVSAIIAQDFAKETLLGR